MLGAKLNYLILSPFIVLLTLLHLPNHSFSINFELTWLTWFRKLKLDIRRKCSVISFRNKFLNQGTIMIEVEESLLGFDETAKRLASFKHTMSKK